MRVGAGRRGFNGDEPGNDPSASSRPLTIALIRGRDRWEGRLPVLVTSWPTCPAPTNGLSLMEFRARGESERNYSGKPSSSGSELKLIKNDCQIENC